MAKVKTLPGRKKYSRGKGRSNPVDLHVGNRIRMRRVIMGMSQEKLADGLGLTFQQVQKYERGANRVSASKLYDFSRILQVPISFFFENFSESVFTAASNQSYALADNDQEDFIGPDVLSSKESLDLLRHYYSITDPKLRRDLMGIIRTMSENIKGGKPEKAPVRRRRRS